MNKKNTKLNYTVDTNNNQRLDKFLSEKIDYLSRSKIHDLIINEHVLVNNKKSKPSYKTNPPDIIDLILPEFEDDKIIPQELDLNILYEDEYYIAINKQPGIIVHPGAGNRSGTLVNGLAFYTEKLSSVGGNLRPGLVHRLDKDTSGVIVAAKTDEAHWKLSTLFSDRKIYKEYHTICWGIPNKLEGEIEFPIDRDKNDRKTFCVSPHGKPALTLFEVKKTYNVCSFLKLVLKTGRTHQARVHLKHLGYPVIGDSVYGKKKILLDGFLKQEIDLIKLIRARVKRQMLHAYKISFLHPFLGKKIEIIAPYTNDMKEMFDILEQKSFEE